MKKCIAFLFSIISSLAAISAITTIEGKAPNYTNQVVRLVAFQDYFTYTPVLVVNDTIDEFGNFYISVDVPQTAVYELRIGNVSATIYLQPKQTYFITFPKLSAQQLQSINSTTTVNLIFDTLNLNDVNALISDFNIRYGRFISANKEALVKRESQKIVKQFKLELDSIYQGSENPYFNTYYTYAVASMEQSARRSREYLFNTYIENKVIPFNNDEFWYFFNDFYTSYLLQYAYENNEMEMRYIINTQKSYNLLFQYFEKAEFADSQLLNEMIILKGLSDLNSNKYYEPQAVQYLIKQIGEKSNNVNVKAIAINTLAQLNLRKKGTEVPNFTLLNQYLDTVNLSDFKGKYVYIDFFATWCTKCRAELDMRNQLYKKYGKMVEFITISIDEDYPTYSKFIAKNRQYRWQFLHSGLNPLLREQYGILNVPSHILIDPFGTYLLAPARKPSEGIGDYFEELKRKK